MLGLTDERGSLTPFHPTYVLRVGHADPVLHDLLPTLDLLHDAHQLARVLRHLLGECADAVRHVQDGCTDLIGFSLQHCMLGRGEAVERVRVNATVEAP